MLLVTAPHTIAYFIVTDPIPNPESKQLPRLVFVRVRDRKKLMNALTVDPLYLQHAQSGRTSHFASVYLLLSDDLQKCTLFFSS